MIILQIDHNSCNELKFDIQKEHVKHYKLCEILVIIIVISYIYSNVLYNMYMYMYRVLAKEWKRGAALLYVMQFPLDVYQRNAIKSQICFDVCVSTTLLKCG